MSNKKILIAFFLGILLIGIVSAVGEAGYCCEKTKIKTDGSGGKMCIFVNNATDCKTGTNPITNSPYKKAPTSCKSTSFCKTGTCINSREGICTTNTYQIDCQKDGGLWDEKDAAAGNSSDAAAWLNRLLNPGPKMSARHEDSAVTKSGGALLATLCPTRLDYDRMKGNF